MNNRPSAFGLLAPFLLILIAGFVYYAKYHWARAWVDERYPWIKENIGSRLPSLVVVVDADGHPVDRQGTAASGGAPAALADSADSADSANTPPSGQLPREYVSPNGAVDLQRLATDRAAWPKTVKLRKSREFPAVVNGKAVGKVEASAGSETRLVAVQAGKLGLEFRGGGAWVAPEDTDIALRLRGGTHQ